MKGPRPMKLRAALLLVALWPACGGEGQAPGGASGAGGGSGSAGSSGGSAGAPAAGSGGTLAATAGSEGRADGGTGSGANGGSSGSGTTGDPTCDLACEHAVACLTNGTLCPELTPQDAGAISTACHEICAVLGADFEALSEHADRCGLALTSVVDNADLSARPNRDVLERCAPSEVCRGACDTVGYCAADQCENLGAMGSAIFSACMDPCSGDEAWISSVNTAQDATGCPASLDAFEVARPGILPAGCASGN